MQVSPEQVRAYLKDVHHKAGNCLYGPGTLINWATGGDFSEPPPSEIVLGAAADLGMVQLCMDRLRAAYDLFMPNPEPCSLSGITKKLDTRVRFLGGITLDVSGDQSGFTTVDVHLLTAAMAEWVTRILSDPATRGTSGLSITAQWSREGHEAILLLRADFSLPPRPQEPVDWVAVLAHASGAMCLDRIDDAAWEVRFDLIG